MEPTGSRPHYPTLRWFERTHIDPILVGCFIRQSRRQKMKILATALVALGVITLPATYAEAREYHHRHHVGPAVIVHPTHYYHHPYAWHHHRPVHHHWDRAYSRKPHFSHN
jgi:hypothetical protein